MCISWTINSLILLMHGATVNKIEVTFVKKKTERRLNSGNPCYRAGANVIDLPVKVQNLQYCKCSGSLYGYEYRLSLQWKNVDRGCLRTGC
jgi:hypothetical protein